MLTLFFSIADDTNLLVPEHTDDQLCDEYDAIKLWAMQNKMIIITSKTKEIAFRHPNPRGIIDLPALQANRKIKKTMLLVVIFSGLLHFDSHVNYTFRVTSLQLVSNSPDFP